ncbi:scaffolding protein D [Klebsiella aerogenes]|uniref:scaffolding protein D n=1 Tax=Klebsiella aerogenes TaxID=548 RepID=UPI0005EFF23B|nr:scaffolding protein D [Klebsiella aerogenes]KJP12291.1 external scaffolding protein D [Klebsiella aerogenes]KZQ48291.1 external scaffolding protein D [Klebsiella aerogenes]
MNQNSIPYLNALASCKLVGQVTMLDLTEDDYEFLSGPTAWTAPQRSRARRCVEAAVYGTLDVVGFPRFPAPAEFVAGAIAYFVHPNNLMSACAIMDGVEFTENIINGVERPLQAREIFAHVVMLLGGNDTYIAGLDEVRQRQFANQLVG